MEALSARDIDPLPLILVLIMVEVWDRMRECLRARVPEFCPADPAFRVAVRTGAFPVCQFAAEEFEAVGGEEALTYFAVVEGCGVGVGVVDVVEGAGGVPGWGKGVGVLPFWVGSEWAVEGGVYVGV